MSCTLFNHFNLKILDDLLKKLEVEHVVWYSDKAGNYYQVIFPVASGEPCETMLHCLVELGIGKKFNSSVRCEAFSSKLKSDELIDKHVPFISLFPIRKQSAFYQLRFHTIPPMMQLMKKMTGKKLTSL